MLKEATAIACWHPPYWAMRGRAPTGGVAREVFLGSACWCLFCAGRCADDLRPSCVQEVHHVFKGYNLTRVCGGEGKKNWREEKLEN